MTGKESSGLRMPAAAVYTSNKQGSGDMATQWGDVQIECPYYLSMHEQKPKCYITCYDDATKEALIKPFNSTEDRRQHILRYCIDREKCPFCPVCIALDFTLELEGEQ